MKISVIIPVYNRENLVLDTLNSVVAQTHNEIELIIVDNNSTDSTLDTITKFKKDNTRKGFEIIIASENIQSAAAARNKGLQYATSDWITFFDSDDIMEPDLLSSYANALADNQDDTDLIMVRADRGNGTTKYSEIHFPHSNLLAQHINHSILLTIRYLIRKDFFISCGAWDNSMLCWDDWELGSRILIKRPRVKWIDNKILIHILEHYNSITGNSFSPRLKLWLHAIDTVENNILKSDIKQKEYYLELLNYRRIALAGLCTRERSPKGKELYNKTIAGCNCNTAITALLRVLYRYVTLGGKGGSIIADKVIKHLIRR